MNIENFKNLWAQTFEISKGMSYIKFTGLDPFQ